MSPDRTPPAGGPAGDARTDEELVAAYVDGDARAFDALVNRYDRRVYAICYRYFGNAADAEDAAQDAFLALLRRASTFTGAAQFSTWMYRVAVNACNDLARKRSRRPQAAPAELIDLADRPEARDALADRELAVEITDALRGLDPDQREAIVLHDLYGMPYADIAARTGVAVGTVKSRIHRGHARLAEALAPDEPGAQVSRAGPSPGRAPAGEPSALLRPPTLDP